MEAEADEAALVCPGGETSEPASRGRSYELGIQFFQVLELEKWENLQSHRLVDQEGVSPFRRESLDIGWQTLRILRQVDIGSKAIA